MQEDSLESFKKDINNIREYIEHINLVNNIPKENNNLHKKSLKNFIEHLRSFNREKKLFEYKAIIISLYGILENTISKWIQEHIKNVSVIVSDYDSLGDKFKVEHFNLSIKLISLITENRHSKFDNINKDNILENLNQSIVSPSDFKLNSEAYIPLSGNLKHIKMIEVLKPLNIDLNTFKSILHIEAIKIDDLVGRRNDIAHGVEIDNILGISEFEDFISALQKYMTNIFNIIVEQEIKYHFQEKNVLYIDEPKEFFHNNQVCIIDLKDTELKIGDILFIEKNDRFSQATIIDIQENGKSTKSSNKGNVGLKVDNPIKKNSKIWKKLT
jgi:hypothetical protein